MPANAFPCEDEEKANASISFKCSDEFIATVDGLAAMDDVKRSKWVRDAVMEKIQTKKRQHECLSRVFGLTTNTANTTDTK